jgi:beta-N-acetylhexosaminidase
MAHQQRAIEQFWSRVRCVFGLSSVTGHRCSEGNERSSQIQKAARLSVAACAVTLILASCSNTPAGHHEASGPTHPTPRMTTTTGSTTSVTSARPSARHGATCSNASGIDTWSLSQRAEQLVVVPAEETDVAQVAPAVEDGVGGVILYGDFAPDDLKAQLATLTANVPAGVRPFIMTDEEGGEVQRMANLVGSFPWPRTMTATMTPAQVTQLAETTAKAMADNGVTMDLAPVLDLASGPGPDALHTDGPRSFSPIPQVAAQYGIAFAQGLEAGGVIPVVKHFPGEGDATANTDDGPASTPPIAQLEAADIVPFKMAIAAGIKVVMVGNASVPGLTSMPASLSPDVINGLLRKQLGFAGLVITDSLSAGAISDIGLSVPEAAADAIEAGADMILFDTSNPVSMTQSIVDQIVASVENGSIARSQLDAAVLQVLAVKNANLC